MARNQEKAASMLSRWLAQKSDGEDSGLKRKRRPHMASECKDLNECDKWRSQILKEIGGKVLEIQNTALTESRIRELNDEINKLMKIKYAWEKQILALGGPNYVKSAPKVHDKQGENSSDDNRLKGPGYKYFGAAKNLPGVKELFEKPKAKKARKSKYELMKSIDADYFGYRDEDDGVLLKVEESAEEGARKEALEEWEKRNESNGGGAAADQSAGTSKKMGDQEEDEFVAYVPLPDDKEIEKKVIEQKKQALLAKYVTQELQQEQDQAQAFIGRAK